MKSVAILLVAAAAVLAAGCGGSGTTATTARAAPSSGRSWRPTGINRRLPRQAFRGGNHRRRHGLGQRGSRRGGVVVRRAGGGRDGRRRDEPGRQHVQAGRDALKNAGIKGEDLRTESISLYPQQDEMGQSIIGYTASSTVHATMNISKAGQIIDRVVAAGANEIYGPTLRVSNSDEQYAQAVDEAFDDARARAEAVAAKAGVTLGAPVAIVEGGGAMPMPYYGTALLERAEGAADMSIEPGEQDIQASLTVTFAIS